MLLSYNLRQLAVALLIAGSLASPLSTDLSTRSPTEFNGLQERSFKVHKTEGTRRPWPKGKITFCYGKGAQKLKPIVKQGWDVWKGKVDLKFEEGNFQLCTLNKEPTKVLRIRVNDKKKAFTTVGYSETIEPTTGTDDENSKFSNYLNFDLSDDYGTLNAVTNMAHEIGHAMGLLHEHQRPIAWETQMPIFSDNGIREEGFMNGAAAKGKGLIRFNCESLADYEKRSSTIKEKRRLCTSYAAAKDAGFSAAEILPMPSSIGTQDERDLDWKSIMLYPSRAGGKIEGGKPTAKKDTRKVVMTKRNGDIWEANHEPSARDIAAVNELYSQGGGSAQGAHTTTQGTSHS